jgi:hypothetical protein
MVSLQLCNTPINTHPSSTIYSGKFIGTLPDFFKCFCLENVDILQPLHDLLLAIRELLLVLQLTCGPDVVGGALHGVADGLGPFLDARSVLHPVAQAPKRLYPTSLIAVCLPRQDPAFLCFADPGVRASAVQRRSPHLPTRMPHLRDRRHSFTSSTVTAKIKLFESSILTVRIFQISIGIKF